MDLDRRARAHAALGDTLRLRIVDALRLGDHTVTELRELVDVSGNLLAHHLNVLAAAHLIERRRSQGDHRRRYVVLRRNVLGGLAVREPSIDGVPLFVCTHNSARSQFAAALWKHRTGQTADSAGTDPAPRVHPMAVTVAADFGIDLTAASPQGYETIAGSPTLVISVCDRARETGPSLGPAPHLHWSIPDPVRTGTVRGFRRAFTEIIERVEQLTEVGLQ